MLTLRSAHDRGHFDMGWLSTYHTFSFGQYHDPEHTGFRTLRVINEDVIAPARGFGSHPHRDMEILTYIVSGELRHKDNMGNGSTIRPGDAQRMSAGSGVLHSEENPSETEPCHLLQIWILPAEEGSLPGYEQKSFPEHELSDRLRLIASHAGRDGSITIHQDADILAGRLGADVSVEHVLGAGRGAWVQLVSGRVAVNGTELAAGDGAALEDEPDLVIHALEDAELVLFDLA
jgi:redox-sensitive bicupin YhaK (pirin superfamily)